MTPRIAVTLLIASLLAPALIQAAPAAAKSEYLLTTGGGLSIAQGKEPLFYSLILKVRKELSAPLYLRTFFERPGKPEDPLIADSKIEPGDRTIFIESPSFQGVKNDTTYSVTIVLFEDDGRTNELSRHVQDIHFSVPKKHFKRLGLKKP